MTVNVPRNQNGDLLDLGSALTYDGPERRRPTGATLADLLSSVLDEIDYGLILVAADGKVLHVNHAARRDQGAEHPLEVRDRHLHARLPGEQRLLEDALHGAQRRGARSMLDLGQQGSRVRLGLTPLPMALSNSESGHAVLLTLQRSQLVEALSISAFARSHGLSPREEEVLNALSQGMKPGDIAQSLGISAATVRSHIHNLKEKTRSRSVVDLFKQLAVLPPLVSALRSS